LKESKKEKDDTHRKAKNINDPNDEILEEENKLARQEDENLTY